MTIPASYEESRQYQQANLILSDAVRKALHSLDWKFEAVGQNSFRGKRPWSIWSWGEQFQIEIEENGIVRMLCKCVVRFTIVSWGNNKRNVRAFFTKQE